MVQKSLRMSNLETKCKKEPNRLKHLSVGLRFSLLLTIKKTPEQPGRKKTQIVISGFAAACIAVSAGTSLSMVRKAMVHSQLMVLM